MKRKLKAQIFLAILILPAILTPTLIGKANANGEEKPIIVCTTNVLGSIVKQYVGNQADVVVLVNPGLCPADYDMKPSDLYAISKAKVLFYHKIQGEYWLNNTIEASGNTNITRIMISGPWNTPEGAKKYIKWIGGNLSQILGIDFTEKMNSMLSEIDTAAGSIQSMAQSLDVQSVNVICMLWQKQFVSWVGFNVTATYPPGQLSASDIENLVQTAKEKDVALIIDNLQSGTEVGEALSEECDAVHVVLTNFPEAIPNTATLAEMMEYNANQLFDALEKWKSTSELRSEASTSSELKSEVSTLRTQLMIFQIVAVIAIVLAVVEAVLLYVKRR